MRKLIVIVICLVYSLNGTCQNSFFINIGPKLNINNVTSSKSGFWPNSFGPDNEADGKTFINDAIDLNIGYRYYHKNNLYFEVEAGNFMLSPIFKASYTLSGDKYKSFEYKYNYGAINLSIGNQFQIGRHKIGVYTGLGWLLDIYNNSNIKVENDLYFNNGNQQTNGQVLLFPNHKNSNTAIFVINTGINYALLNTRKIKFEFGFNLCQGFKPLLTDVVYFMEENASSGTLQPIGHSTSITNGQSIKLNLQLHYKIKKD